jgi:hypothetical protein
MLTFRQRTPAIIQGALATLTLFASIAALWVARTTEKSSNAQLALVQQESQPFVEAHSGVEQDRSRITKAWVSVRIAGTFTDLSVNGDAFLSLQAPPRGAHNFVARNPQPIAHVLVRDWFGRERIVRHRGWTTVLLPEPELRRARAGGLRLAPGGMLTFGVGITRYILVEYRDRFSVKRKRYFAVTSGLAPFADQPSGGEIDQTLGQTEFDLDEVLRVGIVMRIDPVTKDPPISVRVLCSSRPEHAAVIDSLDVPATRHLRYLWRVATRTPSPEAASQLPYLAGGLTEIPELLPPAGSFSTCDSPHRLALVAVLPPPPGPPLP